MKKEEIKELSRWLSDCAEKLREVERKGAAEDKPEGTRYITMSDTLTNMIADKIEKAAFQLRIRK
ncbi:MAG: hypothetical protein ABID54_13310 [Pseudomonadota bacterium]